MVFDWDDMGANHIITDQCQSHDCRAKLDELYYANPNFKATLFAIPGEMTIELLDWCEANTGWIELAVHGFYHRSNYECEKWTYEEMNDHMARVPDLFVKGFKAPGWQISDDCYRWLKDNGWWVADQSYNNERRPKELPAYVNNNGVFTANKLIGKNDQPTSIAVEVEAWHGHTWNCVGNGIYETFDQVKALVQAAEDFKFVSEILQ